MSGARKLAASMPALRAAIAAVLLAAGTVPSPALEVRGAQDVQWVSGGVGADEREEMVMALPDHNLKVLTAAQASGAFIVAVQVVVRDAVGRVVLETSLDGPWLFARLPPGRYDLAATWGGTTQSRSFTVPATGRREVFLYWLDPGVETLPKGATQ